MSTNSTSSRQQFEEYKEEFLEAHSTSQGKPAAQRDRSSWELVKSFLGLLKVHRGAMILSLLTLTVATLLALIPPAATKFVVDYVLDKKPLPPSMPAWFPQEPWPMLVSITVTVIIISLIRIGLQIWGRWHATRVTKMIQMKVRKNVFAQAVRLPLHRVQELKSGGAASILREDAGSVGELVFGMLYNPCRAIIQLLGSLMILAWVDWRLLLGALFLVPLVYLSHRTWISRIRPQHRKIRAQRVAVDALATESFGGMRVVRAFGRQRSETSRVLRGNHLMGRQELYAWWWSRFIEIVWETIIPVASACLLLYGGWQVLQGELTLGDLVMFLAYLLMLLGPLAILAQSAAQFQNSLSGFDRVLDLLDEPREMESATAQSITKAEIEGQVSFDHVSFQYPNSQQYALQEVSLEIAPGETIALVGASGAGKTTFCNLVARFYDPTSGRILLDGRNLVDLDVESYRNHIGVVEQDVFLFDGSIADSNRFNMRQKSRMQTNLSGLYRTAMRHSSGNVVSNSAVGNASDWQSPAPFSRIPKY